MEPVNLNLSERERDWLEKRVAECGYAGPGELVAELIRREQIRLEREAINERLQAAVNSGPSTPVTEESWKARYRELDDDRREKRAG